MGNDIALFFDKIVQICGMHICRVAKESMSFHRDIIFHLNIEDTQSEYDIKRQGKDKENINKIIFYIYLEDF